MADPIDDVAGASGFDKLFSKLSGGDDKPAGLDPNTLVLAMMQQGQQQAQMMMQMMVAMINANANKPAMDPLLIGLLTKQGDNTQFAALLDMQSKQSAALMEQTRASLLSVMETKDAIHKSTLEEAMNRDGGDGDGKTKSHVAEILREVRLGLGALSTMAPPPAVVPALTGAGGPAAANPSHPVGGQAPVGIPRVSAPAQPQAARETAPVLILRNLMDFRLGRVKAKSGVFYSALAATAANDEGLVDALRGGVDDVFAYCAPHVSAHADIMAWLQAPKPAGAPADLLSNADWVNDVIERYVGPLTLTAVDGALDDEPGDDDDGDDDAGDADGDAGTDPNAIPPDEVIGDDDDDNDVPLTVPVEPPTLTPADAAAFTVRPTKSKPPIASPTITPAMPARHTG